jgi:hypothetical protein
VLPGSITTTLIFPHCWQGNAGFGVWGLGFGVWGLGFGVWGLGFGVWGLGFGVRPDRRAMVGKDRHLGHAVIHQAGPEELHPPIQITRCGHDQAAPTYAERPMITI